MTILGLTIEQIAWAFSPMLLMTLAMFFLVVAVTTYQTLKHPPLTKEQRVKLQRRARTLTKVRWTLFALVTITAMVAAYNGQILITWTLFIVWGCMTVVLRVVAWVLKYWAKVSPDTPLPLEYDPTWDDPKPKTKP